MRDKLKQMLIDHEGMKRKIYFCSADRPTIGVGRMIGKGGVGLSKEECLYLLDNDIKRVEQELQNSFEWYERLDDARKDALCDLCFNVGLPSLKGFKIALGFMAKECWSEAATHFLDSKWAKDVGPLRSISVTDMIRTGKY